MLQACNAAGDDDHDYFDNHDNHYHHLGHPFFTVLSKCSQLNRKEAETKVKTEKMAPAHVARLDLADCIPCNIDQHIPVIVSLLS